MTLPTPIVVMHALGSPLAGAEWRDALSAHGWDGPVIAPDLPGHGDTPVREGGSYEYADALLAILPLYRDLDPDLPQPVVVGVGLNGWCAQVLALGGRASGVVLVDGLGGPWLSPQEQIARGAAWSRSIYDDPAATAPAPAYGLDPRAAHGVPLHGSKRLAFKAARAMPVPALIVETPSSSLTAEEVDEVASEYACGARVERMSDSSAASAVAAIVGHRALKLSSSLR